MNLTIFDPVPFGNEYASKLWFAAMREYAKNSGWPIRQVASLEEARNTTVIILTDHLSEERILMLKNNGCKIVGFNVTDSSYISGAIRHAPSLKLVDLIFMLSGVQTCNFSEDVVFDERFVPRRKEKRFLPDEDWVVFNAMYRNGQLQSLPYVPWTRLPDVPMQPYNLRSQKALIRGGGHARRFVLALFLMHIDRLDTNSGMVLFPYFSEEMNTAYRYCEECRGKFIQSGRYTYEPPVVRTLACNSPAIWGGGDHLDISDLGQWNNRCPKSFMWLAEQFIKHHGNCLNGFMPAVEKLLSGHWMHPADHQKLLSRITYTSDLKWMHSIYAPQRFWEAAAAGCINVLPERTIEQDYFPIMGKSVDYLTYDEGMPDRNELITSFSILEPEYNEISKNARQLYDSWIVPTDYLVNTNLLAHIFAGIPRS